jgi:hypothetical protein
MMKLIYLLFAALIALISSLCLADDQTILLTVTGNITKTNQTDKKSFAFSFDELSKLPNTVVRTKTKWTATTDFSGPMVRDVLNFVGANTDAKKVELICHDKFVVTIPISDFKRWKVILAHSKNGQRLTRATKGPLWMMYPLDEYKTELKNNLTQIKLAWGVKEIVVY